MCRFYNNLFPHTVFFFISLMTNFDVIVLENYLFNWQKSHVWFTTLLKKNDQKAETQICATLLKAFPTAAILTWHDRMKAQVILVTLTLAPISFVFLIGTVFSVAAGLPLCGSMVYFGSEKIASLWNFPQQGLYIISVSISWFTRSWFLERERVFQNVF